jgi:cysteine desulfurase
MLPFFVDCYANAGSSLHREGQRAATAVRKARGDVALGIGSSIGEVVFTSGATESNNLAILGLARADVLGRSRIVVSAVEHKCVLNAARHLADSGWDLRVVPVMSDGMVDLGALVEMVDENTALVSIQAANNEIGTIQSMEEIAQIVHRVGAVFHTDAAQALGRIEIDVNHWDVDLLSLSAHKAYGPKGVGALYVRGGAARAPVHPLVFGGGQEEGLRSGTLNVPGIVGFGKAVELAVTNRIAETHRIGALRDHLESRVLSEIPDVQRNGALHQRLAGNASLTLRGCDADALIARMPQFGVSTGAACSSGAIEPSHVLMAIGRPRTEGHQTLRVGLGRFTDRWEIDAFVDHLKRAAFDVRASSVQPRHELIVGALMPEEELI